MTTVHEMLVAMDTRLNRVLEAIELLPQRICQRLQSSHESSSSSKSPTITMTIQEFTQAVLDAASGLQHKEHSPLSSSISIATLCINQAQDQPVPKTQDDPTSIEPAKLAFSTPQFEDPNVEPHDSHLTLSLTSPTLPLDAQPERLLSALPTTTSTTHEAEPKPVQAILPPSSLSSRVDPKPKKRKMAPPCSQRDISAASMVTSTTPVPQTSSAQTAQCLVAGPGTFKWTDGQVHRTPETWQCPATTCKTLWTYWFHGDPINQVGPFHLLEDSDVRSAKSRRLLQRGRAVMSTLVQTALSHNLAASTGALTALSAVELTDVFDKTFELFLDKADDGALRRRGFEKIRWDQIIYYMYGSVFELMTTQATPSASNTFPTVAESNCLTRHETKRPCSLDMDAINLHDLQLLKLTNALNDMTLCLKNLQHQVDALPGRIWQTLDSHDGTTNVEIVKGALKMLLDTISTPSTTRQTSPAASKRPQRSPTPQSVSSPSAPNVSKTQSLDATSQWRAKRKRVESLEATRSLPVSPRPTLSTPRAPEERQRSHPDASQYQVHATSTPRQPSKANADVLLQLASRLSSASQVEKTPPRRLSISIKSETTEATASSSGNKFMIYQPTGRQFSDLPPFSYQPSPTTSPLVEELPSPAHERIKIEHSPIPAREVEERRSERESPTPATAEASGSLQPDDLEDNQDTPQPRKTTESMNHDGKNEGNTAETIRKAQRTVPRPRKATPRKWKFPAGPSRDLWLRWFHGDPADEDRGPYRLLECTKSQIARDAKMLMETMVDVAIQHGLTQSDEALAALPTPKLLAVFDKIFPQLVGTATNDSVMQAPGFQGLEYEELLEMDFRSVLRRLQHGKQKTMRKPSDSKSCRKIEAMVQAK
ncbi:hypothetical protein AC1031_018130 [Aphanomyces cochlioides]|nr:hypothetical protein AC1031_018130 [Aphanomyces cochlioides]